ncbi:MAG: hypothetical protein ACO1QS_19420 [Verrucomicrobiota bacterium]
MKEVPLTKRVEALLLALLIGGVSGFVLGYIGMILVVIASFTIFNSGGGCLGHIAPWFEAVTPFLMVLALVCGLIFGIKTAIKVRKSVLAGY